MEHDHKGDNSSSDSDLSVGDEPFLNEGMINRQICNNNNNSATLTKEKGRVVNEFPAPNNNDYSQNFVE
jgi:hypothetical protein